ncbi:serine/threonine-protein kinase [Streptomyces xiangluensis]|uniref:non-specific serine/threonine protein kinase n=1 Tax=Streptomyces xiangluensis TaxID=2665720 RepID=A0ABV8YZ78_9ACTN
MGTEGANFRVIAGRYRLEVRLGRGGMGVVWRATDQLLGRQVAVKELPLDEELSADEARRQRERTLREAQAVAQLSHPNVMVVHDVVEDDERPYIVMELIDGDSLADRIARRGSVDAPEAARIGVDLLNALRTAHTAGVLHRDIKPANVLIENGTDRVVLTDFGIAQVPGTPTLTESGSFVGSPEYTAPERMTGVRTGAEADLWSVGALLCAVLSGESPFHRDSLGGILHAVVSAEIHPPDEAAPILPVVRGLLERDPDRRLGSAQAEQMLRVFLDTGRTPPVPPGPSTPTRRDVPERQPVTAPPRIPSPARPSPLPLSARRALIAAALVAAMAGAGVSAAALLMRGGGDNDRTPPPTSSAPRTSPGTSPPTSPTPTVTGTRSPTSTVDATLSPDRPPRIP